MKTKFYPITSIRYLFAILLLYLPLIIAAQSSKKYPQHYFRWPLSLRPEIVANMGELRPNHWHMGLDIRTAQRVNQRVYAAADGYIAYAGIRPLSYGRFVKINHPNGLTTLYGHLNDFNTELEKYVTEQQYKDESWEVELTIPPGKFPVKKGDFIAFSGTTGGSQGPHVHFEIRDTQSDECLNPLLFGLPLTDNVRPGFARLALYDRLVSVYEQSPRLLSVRYSSAGKYTTYPASVIKTGSRKISFGIDAYDRISGSNNRDGIYSAKLFLDGKPQVEFVIDSIDYIETRYVNAQVDYKYWEKSGAYIQHLSRMPGDHGGAYHPLQNDGVIELTDNAVHKIRIQIHDAYGNSAELNFSIQYNGGAVKQAFINKQEIFVPGYVNVLERPGFEAYLPEDCLYDTVVPRYSNRNSKVTGAVSLQHYFNGDSIPLHSYMTVRIKPDTDIPIEWKDKLLIKRTYGKWEDVEKAVWQGEWLSAAFNELGTFQVFADLEPPAINELGSGELINLGSSSRIVFTPKDDFGVKSFRAELDGKWLRFTNDKGKSWVYIFDEHYKPGIHELKVTVEDLVGNTTIKTWRFKK